ncbi:unnamed protein product [Orchesella dallaii]|uniref:Uncharacterized protein n=1 Tax=Orchesella dallaii TaxID=48710 RepID=A0ABP1PUC9_9HEXA
MSIWCSISSIRLSRNDRFKKCNSIALEKSIRKSQLQVISTEFTETEKFAEPFKYIQYLLYTKADITLLAPTYAAERFPGMKYMHIIRVSPDSLRKRATKLELLLTYNTVRVKEPSKERCVSTRNSSWQFQESFEQLLKEHCIADVMNEPFSMALVYS